ncbi:Cell division control protein 25 [Termitomyces sp. J132]|nr:Cell division control protein 25 [Termitomyces sp. J132]
MAAVATPMYSNTLFDAQTNHTTTYTSTQPIQHQEEALRENEPFFNTLFCRAIYDYEAHSESSLSFNRGDVIEVLTQEPSGWWDGLLGDERGWFPSNYVEVISDEEAEQIFLAESSGSGSSMSMSHTLDDPSMVDMSRMGHVMMGQEADEWSENDTLPSMHGTVFENETVNTSQTDDYWMPEVGPNGQVRLCHLCLPLVFNNIKILSYVNTQTGQRSREAPELDDEISDTHLAGLTSQLSSRSGSSAGLVFGLNGSSEFDSTMQDLTGFGVPRRTGTTPEPWVRQLGDDGRSFSFYNKVNGQVSQTRPEAPPRASFQASSPPQQRSTNGDQRLSVYSDDSDVHPREPLSHRSTTNGYPAKLISKPKARPVKERVLPDSTTAERLAQALQQRIATPHPDRATEIDELTSATNLAIDAVINNIQMNGMARRAEEDRKMNDLIYNIVLMVRNLLYILATPAFQIPSNVLPREVRNIPLPLQSPLKPVQRKVTATLSRLVLSTRALQYDSGLVLADTLSRIEVDAEGLKKDVAAFVLQVRRLEHSSELPHPEHPKRINGVFSTMNIGLGLVGAGTAGRWKGFGWIRLDDGQASSQRALGPEVISELRQYSTDLNTYFQDLLPALQTSGLKSIDKVRLYGRELVSQIASLLTCVSDVHVARHVDIDGIQQDGSSPSNPYSQTVETARRLVRTLEAVAQAVYNDTAVFLFTLQSVRDSDLLQYRQERKHAWDHLDSLSSSLVANISDLLDTLDKLLSLGHEQAEMSSGDYNGSIEWRMSRVSRVSIRPANMEDDTSDTLVSMAMAFERPPAKPSKILDPSYIQPHANSESMHPPHYTSNEYSLTNILVPEEEQEPHDPDFGAKSAPRATASRKLEKLLGADYASKVAADLQPWYLRPNYSPEDILIEHDNTVKGGTLPALVERLTAHHQVDPTFNQAFLMTFKSFATVNELFDLLVARFRLEPPADLEPEELEDWGKQKKHLIQIRVINTFVTMLKDDDILEKEDFHILERMKAFVSSDEVSQFGAAKQVLVYIDRAVCLNDNNALKAMPQSTPPPPIYPKTTKKLRLADIEPLELARQLTIMESNLYQKIKPMECLQRAREQKTENMDNIATVIQMSNRIADWVADCVLSKEDSRKRASTVKHLISVADRCRTLNNFSSMIAITSGLNTPPIRRLKRTWDQVNQRIMAQFTACEMTIDSNKNFTKYRQLMASVTPPCVPFIGVFLSTLQFIQDGNPDMLPGGLVNFRKRQKASEVINDIKRWQAQSFNLQAIPAVQAFIEESLNQFTDSKASSEQFWALSLEREPREREDERMARLLQESGFL